MPGFHIITLIATAFWLWMLVDCLLNRTLRDTRKVLWFLLILFTHILGPLSISSSGALNKMCLIGLLNRIMHRSHNHISHIHRAIRLNKLLLIDQKNNPFRLLIEPMSNTNSLMLPIPNSPSKKHANSPSYLEKIGQLGT